MADLCPMRSAVRDPYLPFVIARPQWPLAKYNGRSFFYFERRVVGLYRHSGNNGVRRLRSLSCHSPTDMNTPVLCRTGQTLVRILSELFGAVA